MNQKEARRLFIMEKVLQGFMTASEAAASLNLSERQIYRLKGGMKKFGVAFLAHKNRGRTPKHAVPQALKNQIIELYSTLYWGASMAHFAELIAQHHGISLSPKTLGRIIAQAGIANRHSHKAPRQRRTRERKRQEGLLVLVNASLFRWLEE